MSTNKIIRLAINEQEMNLLLDVTQTLFDNDIIYETFGPDTCESLEKITNRISDAYYNG